MQKLELRISDLLAKRKWLGVQQNELYSGLGYSRSYVSELLKSMSNRGLVIREKEGRLTNRVWLSDFYPSYRKGEVRTAFLRSSEYAPFLSVLKEITDRKGMRLALRPMNSAVEMIAELQHSALELALAPTFTHLLLSLIDREQRILCGIAGGGSGVLKNERASNRILATSESSTMSLISRAIARRKDTILSFYDEPAKASADFLKGAYSYLAIWEPYLSHLLSHGGVAMMPGSEGDAMSGICCSAGVSPSLSESDPFLAREIRTTYESATAEGKMADMDFGIGAICSATGFDRARIMSSLGSYRFSASMSPELLVDYSLEIGVPVSPERAKGMIFR